jgi:polyhydroxybutyrate depolymerase
MKIVLLVFAAACAACLAGSAFAAGPQPCAGIAHVPVLAERELNVGGAPRRYAVRRPEAAPAGPLPVIFDLQASGVTPLQEMALSGMGQAATARGYLVVAPYAVAPFPSGGATWNVPRQGGPDDVAFIAAVLDDLTRAYCIDPSRVFLTGFSGGARLASEVACAFPGRFAALGVVGGLRAPPGEGRRCHSGGRTPPVLALHSLDDPVNPYWAEPGKSPPYWTHGFQQAVDEWATASGCEPAPEYEYLRPHVLRWSYRRCPAGSRVVAYRLQGGGHTWPGSRYPFPSRLGSVESRLDATALVLDFFAEASK